MKRTLIHNATIVNEGRSVQGSVVIEGVGKRRCDERENREERRFFDEVRLFSKVGFF